MSQQVMYPGTVNSKYTILTAGITDVATSIPVDELGVLPAAPNIAVLGSGSDAETVLYTVKSAATGAGTLTVTREWNKTGTTGAKKAWLAGTVISRRFTEYDHATFKANIEDHETRVGALETLDSLVYKGVIACAGNPNYPAGNAGDFYKVSTAGRIGGASGKIVEIGDMALCNTDGTTTGDEAAKGTYWDVIQANIDGAVVGPASATADAIVLFNSTTGKIIKDSTKTIVTTLGADDTTLPTSKAVKDVTGSLVTKALFDAQSIIAAVSDDTPAAVVIAENDIVGRLPSGNVAGVTLADLTEESTPATGDFLLGWESGGAIRKFDIGDLPASSGDVATDPIWDAAGDLVIGTGANTAGKLTKGAEGKVLTAGASTLSWETPAAGAAAIDDLTDVNISSIERGDILYRNATEWVNIHHGTDGQVLTTKGNGADPVWADKPQVVITKARRFLSILQALVPATNGVTIDQYETSTNKIAQDYALFSAGVTKYLQWKIGLDDWNTTTLKFEPVYDSVSGNNGTVIFTADAIRLPDGGTIDTACGTAISSTDTYQGSGVQHLGPQSADVTPAGASGDLIVLRLTRGADSLDGEVRLTGIWVEWPVTRV